MDNKPEDALGVGRSTISSSLSSSSSSSSTAFDTFDEAGGAAPFDLLNNVRGN